MPAGRRPVFCYVTDRHAFEASPGSLYDSIRTATAAAVDWIQIREKDLEGRPLVDVARFAASEAQWAGARVLVNDRLDVALVSGAAGVHLGEKSLPIDAVTKWRASSGRAEFLIGVSCHSLESARSAERGGADYIFFGPLFETPSKAEFGAPQELGLLEDVCAAVQIPVLAIGGVNFENARSCLDAGAAGIAAIRLFQQATSAAELRARLLAI